MGDGARQFSIGTFDCSCYRVFTASDRTHALQLLYEISETYLLFTQVVLIGWMNERKLDDRPQLWELT